MEVGKTETREWTQGVFTMVTTRGQCGSSYAVSALGPGALSVREPNCLKRKQSSSRREVVEDNGSLGPSTRPESVKVSGLLPCWSPSASDADCFSVG